MRSHLAVLLLFFIVGFIVYSGSLNNEFLLDDEVQVQNNPYLKDLNGIRLHWLGASGAESLGADSRPVYYRPLMFTIFSFIY